MDNPQQEQSSAAAQQHEALELDQLKLLKVWKKEEAKIAAQMGPEVKRMLEPGNRDTPYTINSYEEFLSMEIAHKSLQDSDENSGKYKSYMLGWPSNTADQMARVAELTAAIKDLSSVPAKAGRQHTASKEAVESLATVEVQLLGWKILRATCKAHLGRHHVPVWTRSKSWTCDTFMNFNERFSAVLGVVNGHKRLVKDIIEADVHVVKRLAAHPARMLRYRQKHLVIPSIESESLQIANPGDGTAHDRGIVDNDENGTYNDASSLPASGDEAPTLESRAEVLGAPNEAIASDSSLFPSELETNTAYVNGVDDLDYESFSGSDL
ncbi:hypothetical protein Daus18300_009852 [Diaporthe australafricana]|uniref:Uncharacterized protein n=1 Tax=Diaporthe australafricana TaxID=127596 RepID=A0ABR3WCV6_9PEZI